MTHSMIARRGARVAILGVLLGTVAAAVPALAGNVPPPGGWQIPPPPGKEWLTVAAVTMNAKPDVAANLQVILSRMEEAASQGAQLVVFPELALQGCPGWREQHVKPSAAELAYSQQTAETIPGLSTALLVEQARALNLFVVFGMMEKDEATGQLYNTSVLLGPEGVIGKHRKTVSVDNDDLIFRRGSGYIVLDSPVGKIGLMICAEMADFPAAGLASKGAELLVTASAWPANPNPQWDEATAGNAARARRWHVVSNLVGPVGYATYGHSRVVDPLGRIVADTGQKEGMVVWATDLMIDAGPDE